MEHSIREKRKPADTQVNYTSTSWTSSSSVSAFIPALSGRGPDLFKNGRPYLDNDIIVIFEDDADVAIRDVNATLVEELSNMTTDILYLGWCEGRLARPVPICMHAYAITRRGARLLMR